MQRMASVLGIVTMLFGFAATARGQSPGAHRWFVHVNGAGQASTDDVHSSVAFTLYEEDASIDVSREPKGGLFDLTAGTWMVSRWIPRIGPGTFGAAITFSRRGRSSTGALTGSLPDPIEFNRHRQVTGTVPGLNHSETWVAPQLFYRVPLFNRLSASAFIGPAVVSIDSDAIQSVNVGESASGPVIEAVRVSAGGTFTGVSAGLDVQYDIARYAGIQIGAGLLMRYQEASGTLDGRDYTAGGAQFGGGVRFGF